MLSTPPEKTYPPLNRPFPPKIAIGPNPPPLLRIFKNLQSPPPKFWWGIPTMIMVVILCDFGILPDFLFTTSEAAWLLVI